MITMKHIRNILTCIFLISTLKTVGQTTKQITFTNPITMERKDELVVLSRGMLEQKLGKIAAGKFIQLKGKNGRPLVVQLDDLNNDTKWDEAVFLYSFKPKEKLALTLSVTDHPAAVKTVVRAHVRLRKKNADDSFGPQVTNEVMPVKNQPTDFAKQPLPLYLTEGPAWENDKVAFRQYLDTRNGRDIFGKRVTHMVMDSVGVNVSPSYHNLANWGMDVLKVGKSLGAGAIALQTKINGTDTLIRLGGEDITNTVYEQVSDGPVRAIFRIKYDWKINGRIIKITDETNIWGGQYFYESKISIVGAPEGSKLVSGIVNLHENVSKHFEINNAAVLYSHGPQSENNDELGMAIVVKNSGFAGFGATPNEASEVLNTYTVAQKIQTDKPLVYRFYAGWVLTDPGFSDALFFEEHLKKETRKMQVPVTVFIR